MKVIIRFAARDEIKALPLLLRHSPGMVLPNRTYILSEEAVKLLRRKRVRYTVLCRESSLSR